MRERMDCGRSCNHRFGDIGKATIVVACVRAHEGERCIHVDAIVFSEHSFGLFDDDPAGQGA